MARDDAPFLAEVGPGFMKAKVVSSGVHPSLAKEWPAAAAFGLAAACRRVANTRNRVPGRRRVQLVRRRMDRSAPRGRSRGPSQRTFGSGTSGADASFRSSRFSTFFNFMRSISRIRSKFCRPSPSASMWRPSMRSCERLGRVPRVPRLACVVAVLSLQVRYAYDPISQYNLHLPLSTEAALLTLFFAARYARDARGRDLAAAVSCFVVATLFYEIFAPLALSIPFVLRRSGSPWRPLLVALGAIHRDRVTRGGSSSASCGMSRHNPPGLRTHRR